MPGYEGLDLHNHLLKIQEELGYGKQGGVCHGYSLRWIEAIMLGQEALFNERLQRILSHENLAHAFMQVKSKNKPLSDEDKSILDMVAFLQSVELYQNSKDHKDLFNPQDHVWEGNIETLSSLASSDACIARGGLTKIFTEPGVYSPEQLMGYLDSLSSIFESSSVLHDTIEAPSNPIGLLLSSNNHTIALVYMVGLGWCFNDINQAINVFPEEDLSSLAEAIYTSFLEGEDISYTAFNTAVILPANDQRVDFLTEELEKFKKTHPVTKEIALSEAAPALAFLAAQQGETPIIAQLGQLGADFNHVSFDGQTPAMAAATMGHLDVLVELAKYSANFDKRSLTGETLALMASERGHATVVAFLGEQGADLALADDEGNAPVHVAAQYGDVALINKLAKFSVNFNQSNAVGLTPLLIAAQEGHASVINALARYVDLNQTNPEGTTAAIFAAMLGHVSVIFALGEAGADLNKALPNGLTPALAAAKGGMVDVLVALGACGVNLKDQRLASTAALEGHASIISELAKHGVDLSERLSNGATLGGIAANLGHISVITALGQSGVDLGGGGNDGVTPMHFAAQNNNVLMVRELLKYTANLNQPMRNGVTPAYVAAERGLTPIVDELAQAGVDFNVAMTDGKTPLFVAARGGFFPTVVALLKNGADPFKALTMSRKELELYARPFGDKVINRMNALIQQQLTKGQQAELISVLPADIALVMGHKGLSLFLRGAEKGLSAQQPVNPAMVQSSLFHEKREDKTPHQEQTKGFKKN